MNLIILEKREQAGKPLNLEFTPHLTIKENKICPASGLIKRLFNDKENHVAALNDDDDHCLYDPMTTLNQKRHVPKDTMILYWDGIYNNQNWNKRRETGALKGMRLFETWNCLNILVNWVKHKRVAIYGDEQKRRNLLEFAEFIEAKPEFAEYVKEAKLLVKPQYR